MSSHIFFFLKNVSCVLKKNVSSAMVDRVFTSSCLIVLFKSFMSLIIFSLVVSSSFTNGELMSPTLLKSLFPTSHESFPLFLL